MLCGVTTRGTLLVARLHVDLQRVISAACQA
ncbi:putative leader peptide [Cryptosporangium sp. NPDC051539]